MRFWIAVVACAALFAGVTVVAPLVASSDEVTGGGAGSVLADWVDNRPVWVVTEAEGRTVVVDAVNPHPWFGMKELVGWCESADVFQGFYDGSRFDAMGYYVFGPAPHGLHRHEVKSRGGTAVRVGRVVESTTRLGSNWSQPSDVRYCWTDPGFADPGFTDPIERPASEPMAEFHERFPDAYTLVEGVAVVTSAGGVLCERLARPASLECEGPTTPLLDARLPHPEWGEAAVIHARFAGRRTRRGFTDVTVLPDGYTRFVYEP